MVNYEFVPAVLLADGGGKPSCEYKAICWNKSERTKPQMIALFSILQEQGFSSCATFFQSSCIWQQVPILKGLLKLQFLPEPFKKKKVIEAKETAVQ